MSILLLRSDCASTAFWADHAWTESFALVTVRLIKPPLPLPLRLLIIVGVAVATGVGVTGVTGVAAGSS